MPGVVHFAAQDSTSGGRLSASCQRIVDEHFGKDSAMVTIRSCLADSELLPMIEGHRCNKTPLTPSSLNADMALTVGEYIWAKAHPGATLPGLNVGDMAVMKPLIARIPQEAPGQYMEMSAVADWTQDTVRCEFRAVEPDGAKIQDWARCVVRYEDKQGWSNEWSRYSHMVRTSMARLRARSREQDGKVHVMQTGMAYKLFESFVHYDELYRGMAEVIFDGLEGTSRVRFQTGSRGFTGPVHIDNSCHLSGFLCNGHDLDSEDSAYISEGWEGMRYLDHKSLLQRPAAPGFELSNYVRMQPRPGNILQGDVYIFDKEELVGVWEGIKFKQIPRRVLNIFLPPPKQ